MKYAYSHMAERNVSNVSTDRILKLITLPGGAMRANQRNTFSASMLTNTEIHAVQEAGLWCLKYKTPEGYGAGKLPEMLKQRWTNFNQMKKFLDTYFLARNVKIEEVIA
jgi:hypothetical protein